MSDTESDEELKRAIALSLEESTPPKGGAPTVIDLLSSDDEDDDLDAPVNARHNRSADTTSGRDQSTAIKTPKSPVSQGRPLPAPAIKHSEATPTPSLQPGGSVLQGLDRKAMEEARLARNALKRKEHPTSSPSDLPIMSNKQARKLFQSSASSCQGTTTDSASTTPEPSSLGTQDPFSPPSHAADARPQEKNPNVMSYQDQQRLGSPGIQFPMGVIRKTWAHGQPRIDDIKIEEVLQKDDLDLAVLSTFQIDSDWIISKLKDTTKVIWVLQAKGQAQKENIRSEAPKNYRFCFPNMDGNISCMHSKLQLLSHPTHLRVVVPSANLTNFDWGEMGGIMENIVFMIDLPRLPAKQEASHNQLTPFAVELLFFLEALGIDAGTINSVKRFDFSQTANLAFVHSIGGSHADWKREGFCGLGTSVRTLGLNSERAPKVDFVAASIGSLNDSFLKSMYLAIMGHTQGAQKERTWLEDQGQSGPPSKTVSDVEVKSNSRIYFPTRQTVEASKGGKASGGTICFQRKWYESASFPRSLMVDMQSTRQGILSHSKMIFVRGSKPWVYVGSANLSEAAWGRLVKDKKTGEPRHISCRNWECGVIFPVVVPQASAGGSAEGELGHQGMMNMDIFRGHVPVPMIVPGEGYGGKEPWYFNSL